jgi:copper chaperone
MCETTSEVPITDDNSSSCSCCGTGAGSSTTAGTGNIQLQVQGMTCGHCVSSVTEELEEIDGVRNVSVALDPNGTSTVTVDADSGIDQSQLHAAVADAGYEVVTS